MSDGAFALMIGTLAFAVAAFVFLCLVISMVFPPDDENRPSGGGMVE